MKPSAFANDQWNVNAELFKTALEDKPGRASASVVFPRIMELFGNIAGKSVLDFGCGSGRFSRALAEKGALVTAYDSAVRQLELAKAANPTPGVQYHNLLHDIAENSFDCAICFQVLVCNPPDPVAQIVRDIHSRLSPGGFGAFVNTNTEVVGRSYDGGYTELPESQTAGAPYNRHFKSSKGDFDVVDFWYSPADLRKVFANANFEILTEEILVDYFVLHFVRKP